MDSSCDLVHPTLARNTSLVQSPARPPRCGSLTLAPVCKPVQALSISLVPWTSHALPNPCRLFSGLPTAPSELLNPSWWRTLLDPANRAVLDAAGAGAQDSASGPQVQAPGGADAPELRLAQRVAGELRGHNVVRAAHGTNGLHGICN